MDFRQAPGMLLTVTGGALLSALITDPPSAAKGGPAIPYTLLVILCLGGGGGIAALAGVFSLRTGQTRLPAVLLAGYGAVGLVYAVIRLRLFLALSAVGFTIIALCFISVVIYGVFHLTSTEGGTRV